MTRLQQVRKQIEDTTGAERLAVADFLKEPNWYTGYLVYHQATDEDFIAGLQGAPVVFDDNNTEQAEA